MNVNERIVISKNRKAKIVSIVNSNTCIIEVDVPGFKGRKVVTVDELRDPSSISFIETSEDWK